MDRLEMANLHCFIVSKVVKGEYLDKDTASELLDFYTDGVANVLAQGTEEGPQNGPDLVFIKEIIKKKIDAFREAMRDYKGDTNGQTRIN